MPFGWKKAEQEQQQRDQRARLTAGVAMTSVGIISILLHLAIGHPDDLSNGVIPTCIGGLLLVASQVNRRRQTAPPPDQ